MANINHEWRRWVAVGCNHGHLANQEVCNEVFGFTQRYRPQTRVHLGDNIDTAAFRSGAAGTPDEAVSLESDLNKGLEFVRRFRPTHWLNGNHCDRLWKNATHHNAIISECARALIREIEALARRLKCQHIDHYDINRSWVELGDTKFLHGFMFNENAIRDHAEHFGRCVHAHLHVVGSAAARRSDHAKAWCVGTLADIPALNYAKTRRATARWQHGLAYGEYSDKSCMVWLAERSPEGKWNWPL